MSSSMTPLVVDVETTTIDKGNPYVAENKLCYIGLCFDKDKYFVFNTLQDEYRDIELYNYLLIGFNLKFDLSWLRRYGIDFSSCSIWDCQLAYFILSGQVHAYPSLNDVAEHYGLGSKLDVIELEYWSKGIDTPDIPPDVMEKYLTQDLKLTWEVYQKQLQEFETQPELFKLFQLQCEDLLTLQEMEYNGLLIDSDACNREAVKCETRIAEIDEALKKWTGDIPFNPSSGDHLSCLLYGGTIVHETRVPVGFFKTGAKVGQVRYKKVEYTFPLPRIFEPLRGSNLQKDGYYSTDEDTLSSLTGHKDSKKLLDLILERSKLEKLLGTYFRGWPKHVSNFDGMVHGRFNQVVVRTGRLSASNPNQQNLAPEMKELIVSRYD